MLKTFLGVTSFFFVNPKDKVFLLMSAIILNIAVCMNSSGQKTNNCMPFFNIHVFLIISIFFRYVLDRHICVYLWVLINKNAAREALNQTLQRTRLVFARSVRIN